MADEAVVASKKRIVLAVYLDFLLFSVLWGYALYFVSPEGEVPFWIGLLAFAIIWGTTYRLLNSPGMHILGIDRSRNVDPDIARREHWLTILLGVVFMLDGTKSLVRWTQIDVPEPFFGVLLTAGPKITVDLAWGAFSVAAGYLILKLKPAGYWLGLALAIVMIVSCLISWDLWQEASAQIVEARRAAQGREAKADEVGIAQIWLPVAILAWGLGIVSTMLLMRRRFSV